MTSLLRCAHISDLHFAKLSWCPSQFFSKRWIGNLNLLFSRRRDYSSKNLYALIDIFVEKQVKCVFITGDLTTTSLSQEFEAANTFITALKKAGLKVFAIPGNHDKYTRSACKNQTFYDFFSNQFSQSTYPNNWKNQEFDLKTTKFTASWLGNNWWLIALDTAIATPWLSSRGHFSLEQETALKELLSSIPSDHSIILTNHFPFFENDSPRKILKRGKALQKLLQQFPNVRFYLHGHTHRHCIADLRASGLPLILDSGSTAHKEQGSWNFIDITQDGCFIEAFHLNANRSSWKSSSIHPYKW